MPFIARFFWWCTCLGCCAASSAQTLLYEFALSGQTLNAAFRVEGIDVLQGRAAGGNDWQIDLIIRSKLSNQNLQLLAKAGRYNLVLVCQGGNCELQAPNLSKKVDLPGSEVKEQIYMRVLAGEGVYANAGVLQSKNGMLPAKLKVRILPEGAEETRQAPPATTTPKRSAGLGGETIGIE